MRLPSLTHLQLLVLSVIGPREKSGREIRSELAKSGVRQIGPAFYQLMSRLEKAKFVRGRYEQVAIGGDVVRERRYQLIGAGADALNRARQFYGEILSPELQPEGGRAYG